MKRYFIGIVQGRIYALYRATFKDRTLISEDRLNMPNGKRWTKTQEVSNHLINYDEDMQEVDLKELQSHLPAGISA